MLAVLHRAALPYGVAFTEWRNVSGRELWLELPELEEPVLMTPGARLQLAEDDLQRHPALADLMRYWTSLGVLWRAPSGTLH